jgi:hypothetical protein
MTFFPSPAKRAQLSGLGVLRQPAQHVPIELEIDFTQFGSARLSNRKTTAAEGHGLGAFNQGLAPHVNQRTF